MASSAAGYQSAMDSTLSEDGQSSRAYTDGGLQEVTRLPLPSSLASLASLAKPTKHRRAPGRILAAPRKGTSSRNQEGGSFCSTASATQSAYTVNSSEAPPFEKQLPSTPPARSRFRQTRGERGESFSFRGKLMSSEQRDDPYSRSWHQSGIQKNNGGRPSRANSVGATAVSTAAPRPRRQSNTSSLSSNADTTIRKASPVTPLRKASPVTPARQARPKMKSGSPTPPRRDTSPSWFQKLVPSWLQKNKEEKADHGLHSAPFGGSEKRTQNSAEAQPQESWQSLQSWQSAPVERSEQIQGVHSAPIERSEQIIDFESIDFERCESDGGESSQSAQEVEAFIKANEHLLRGMAEDIPIKAGAKILYQKSIAEPAVKVTVLKVHHEDDPPYYTIRMLDGREVQTVRSKLMFDSQEPLYGSADTTALKRVLGIVGAKVAALEAQIQANQVDNIRDSFYRKEMEKYDALLAEEGFTKDCTVGRFSNSGASFCEAPVADKSVIVETHEEFQDLASTRSGSSISCEAQSAEKSYLSVEKSLPRVEETQEEFHDLANSRSGSSVSCEAQSVEKSYFSLEKSLPRVEETQEEFHELANSKSGSSVSCEAQCVEKSYHSVEKSLPRVEETQEEFHELANSKSGSSVSCEAQAAEKSFQSVEEKSLPSVEEIPEELHELANARSEANGKNRVDLVKTSMSSSCEAQSAEKSLPSVEEEQDEFHELEKEKSEVNARDRVDLVMTSSSSSCEVRATEESFASVQESQDEFHELEKEKTEVNARERVDLVMTSSSSSCEAQATEESVDYAETHDELHELQKEKSDVNARDPEDSDTTRSPSPCEDEDFEVGASLLYQKPSDAVGVCVTLVKVHYDHSRPHFTIRMPDGTERGAVRAHLWHQEELSPSTKCKHLRLTSFGESAFAATDQAAKKPSERMEILDELHKLENTKSEINDRIDLAITRSSSSNDQFAADDSCVKVGSFCGSIADSLADSLESEMTSISACGSSFSAMVERKVVLFDISQGESVNEDDLWFAEGCRKDLGGETPPSARPKVTRRCGNI